MAKEKMEETARPKLAGRKRQELAGLDGKRSLTGMERIRDLGMIFIILNLFGNFILISLYFLLI